MPPPGLLTTLPRFSSTLHQQGLLRLPSPQFPEDPPHPSGIPPHPQISQVPPSPFPGPPYPMLTPKNPACPIPSSQEPHVPPFLECKDPPPPRLSPHITTQGLLLLPPISLLRTPDPSSPLRNPPIIILAALFRAPHSGLLPAGTDSLTLRRSIPSSPSKNLPPARFHHSGTSLPPTAILRAPHLSSPLRAPSPTLLPRAPSPPFRDPLPRSRNSGTPPPSFPPRAHSPVLSSPRPPPPTSVLWDPHPVLYPALALPTHSEAPSLVGDGPSAMAGLMVSAGSTGFLRASIGDPRAGGGGASSRGP